MNWEDYKKIRQKFFEEKVKIQDKLRAENKVGDNTFNQLAIDTGRELGYTLPTGADLIAYCAIVQCMNERRAISDYKDYFGYNDLKL